MSADHEFERAEAEFVHAMQVDAQKLSELHKELKRIQGEESALVTKNVDDERVISEAKRDMEQNRKKTAEDERREKKLIEEIRQLERLQLERHAKLASLSRENQARLLSHGVKVPTAPGHSSGTDKNPGKGLHEANGQTPEKKKISYW